MLLFLFCVVHNIGLLRCLCLTESQAIRHGATGNDIEWTTISANVYATTFVFDVSTISWPAANINAQITTRLFNDSFPSQTVRFKRGNQYQVTVINNLGPESPYNPTTMNVWKDPNTTNIHTHGCHISGTSAGDSVFVKIAPGEQHTYIYNIPCDHSGGIFWWHPHHHGSTHLQVAAGAAGALIIEDDAEMEGLPAWYSNMTEIIFFITHIHFLKYGTMLNRTWDYVWNYTRPSQGPPGDIDTYFVNGQFRPNVCMTAGTWLRFRFALIETTELPPTYYIADGECSIYLLARDGVIVHGENDEDMPRLVTNAVFLPQSGRADVAVSCPGGSYDFWTYDTNGGRKVIATLDVVGGATEPLSELTPFTPIRPTYLRDNLLHYDGALEDQLYADETGNNQIAYWPNVLVTGASIAGKALINETSYLQRIALNTINTWQVTTSYVANQRLLHPFHVHLHHFQMLNSTLPSNNSHGWTNYAYPAEGYQVRGDWLDTIWGPGWIKFKTSLFAGTVTVHCHILQHEDQGAMGTVEVTNGCDALYEDYAGDGACQVYQCEEPTQEPSGNPTAGPTAQPSESPITGPTQQPSESPTAGSTAQPSGNPTAGPMTQPSESPITGSTAQPSENPTAGPTQQPLESPTAGSTTQPSGNPSVGPTESTNVISSTSNEENMDGNGGGGVNKGYVLIIIILCSVVVFLVVGIGYFIYKNRKQKMQLQESYPSHAIHGNVVSDDVNLLQTTDGRTDGPKAHIVNADI